MKFLALACVIASASAFTAPTMTFAVGKKTPAKKAATTKPVPAPKPMAKKAAPKPVAKKAAPAPKPKPAPKKAAPKPKPVAKKVAPKPVAKKVAPKPVAKKVAPKPAPKKVAPKPAPRPRVAAASVGVVPSTAVPGEVAPALLDGSLVGDVGFDPCFLSTKADSAANYFNGIFGTNIDGLSWYREAELMHGRIAMMAAVGFIVPGFFHWPGSSLVGSDAYNFPNPLDAWNGIPGLAAAQVAAFLVYMEFRRINIILKDGNSYQVGASQKWGQGGEGFYNPFNLNYTPAEYAEKQLQEIKHARLAMIGLLGLYLQANISGVGVVEQWATAFTAPDYYAKAGYFLPEGI